MNYRNKSVAVGASFIALSLTIAGCGSDSGVGINAGQDLNANALLVENSIDVSDASIVSEATKLSGGTLRKSGRDFSFPQIIREGELLFMVIPAGPLPAFPARRTVVSGNGQTIEFGDPVTLKYDMFAWSSGELVESSSSFEEAHIVQGGVSDDFPIPEYLAKSLLGRSIGDTVQVVFPVGTEDLPAYLDPADAYVLLVELL